MDEYTKERLENIRKAAADKTFLILKRIVMVPILFCFIPIAIFFTTALFFLIINFFKLVVLGDWAMSEFSKNISIFAFHELKLFLQPLWDWYLSFASRLYS